jgi:hypothetical protein
MDVPGEQCDPDLPLKFVNSPANDIDGQFKTLRGGPELPQRTTSRKTLAASIRKARGDLVAFLWEALPREMDTVPSACQPQNMG